MGQRQAFLLATFLTTFGLILIGAVAFRLTNTPETAVVEGAADPLASTDSTTAKVLTPDQQAVNDLVASRQLAYEQALTQANAQLQAANEQLAQLQGGLVAPAPQSPPSVPASNEPDLAVSAAGAEQIALAAAPNAASTAAPLLVDFQGTVAYEIGTNAGLLYIDATTGAVLFNGTVPAPAASAPAMQAPVAAPQSPAPVAGPATNTATTTDPTAAPAPPPASAPAPATISGDQALAIATSAVGPGTVDQMKLEDEHGILIWDVKFTNDNEVRIDAYTGTIVRTRIENDND